MRKYLLFALLLCIQWSAHGQTTYDYRYWFDMDEGNQHTGTSSTGSWNIEADLSGLDCSLHAIHIQVKDTSGVWSAPKTRYFVKMPDRTLAGGNYWFDNDFLSRQPLATVNGKFDVDVSSMSETLHYIHFQANDAAGYVSSPFTSLFMKLPIEKSLSYRYWIDNDQTTMKSGKLTGESMMFDVSDLTDGFHVITLQVDGNGGSSIPANRMFIKIPQTEGVSELTCMCTIDGKVYKQEKVASSGGVVDWSLDVSPLSQGLHRIQVQVFTPSGAATDIYDSFFFRTTMDGELQNMNLVYSIDGGDHKSIKGSYNNGMFHFDMDVASIEDGLHNMTYMLASETGTSTKVNSAFFMKTPVGGPGIISYKYWLNDYEDETRYVKLEERKNPFDLITLLPVDTCPIRSSCFHFEIQDDGTPMVYAKNDIHFQFYDVSNRVAEAHKQYVDYNVGETITDLTLLESGKCNIEKPGENAVKWFKIEACEGDTIAFRSNQATSIQVFSPTGKEIYSVSGYESTNWSGCHTWEDGVHYVAVHDVQGTQTNVTLEYMHMDKYDVVDQDVKVVGNGGCSTITFKGNGFRDLYAVDFVSSSNDTIHSFSIGHESDGTTSVTADFTDVDLGKYTALFHFTEGKKYIYDAITVEEAKPIELSTEVTFPSTFGHVVTYTCKITNSGNMTAYAVPIYTWIKSKTLDGIYHIEYDGLDLAGLFDGIISDSLTNDEKKKFKELSESAGDDHHFLKFWVEDEDNPGDSVFVRSNYFFTNIAPYETKTLRLTISTKEVDAFAYFTVPQDWPSYVNMKQADDTSAAKVRFKTPNLKDEYCCIKERVECVASLVADGASIANMILQYSPDLTTQTIAGVVDCVAGSASKIISTAGTIMCGENNVENNFWEQVQTALDGTSTIGTLSSCLSQLLPWKKAKAILEAIGNVAGGASLSFGLGVDFANCAIAFASKKPNCPPVPPGGGGSGGGRSHDPNDIYGYLAESGSKYMSDVVKTVTYRIEFENDTTFATASAMIVEICDTLDGELFDLSSYTPTGIKIGDKIEHLDGNPNFVKTIDMRPSINGLVSVEGKYDVVTGILKWTFTSLDPMTLEATINPMDGFLPINRDGNGIGDVSFNINMKQGLPEGTIVPNRASIIFDINEPIITPTWTNIIDATAPISRAADIEHSSDSTAVLSIEATDELSGMWRYDVYVQYGSGTWFLAAENVPADTTATVKIYEGIDHGFYVVATDSAGNVEQKEPMRELSYNLTSVVKGDVNGDGRISIVDITMVTNAVLKKEDENFNAEAADMNLDGRVSIVDATMITNIILKK